MVNVNFDVKSVSTGQCADVKGQCGSYNNTGQCVLYVKGQCERGDERQCGNRHASM